MNWKLLLYRNQGEAGGGATPPAPAASPAASPAPQGSQPPQGGQSQSEGQGGAPAPQNQGSNGQPPAQAAKEPFKSALEGLPKRGTLEYREAFANLPRERQEAIEREVFDRETNPEKYAELEKDAKGENQTKPDEIPPENLGWSEEEFQKLDPHTQATVKQMQGIIDEVRPYIEDGKLKEGMAKIVTDPLIKSRMAEMQGAEDPYAIPAELQKAFDPAAYLDPKTLGEMDFVLKPNESREALSSALQKAYEDGARQATMKAEYKLQGEVAVERRKGVFATQVQELVSQNPSLKSDLPTNDPNNPVNPFLKWAGEHLGDVWVEKHGMKVAYATYLASSGNLDKTISNVAKKSVYDFIKKVQDVGLEGARNAVTMGKNGVVSPQANTPQELGGIDATRYLSDMTYRRQAFNQATPEIRRKLETLVTTGKT